MSTAIEPQAAQLVHSLHAWALVRLQGLVNGEKSRRLLHAVTHAAVLALEQWGDKALPELPEQVSKDITTAAESNFYFLGDDPLERPTAALLQAVFREGKAWGGRAPPAIKMLSSALANGHEQLFDALMQTKKTPTDLASVCVFPADGASTKRHAWLRAGADGATRPQSTKLSLPGMATLAMVNSYQNQWVQNLGQKALRQADWQANATSNGHRLLALASSSRIISEAWAVHDQWIHSPTATQDLCAAASRVHPRNLLQWVQAIPQEVGLSRPMFDALIHTLVQVYGSVQLTHEWQECLEAIKALFDASVNWPAGQGIAPQDWQSKEGLPLDVLMARELLSPSLGCRELPEFVAGGQSLPDHPDAVAFLGGPMPPVDQNRMIDGYPAYLWLEAWKLSTSREPNNMPSPAVLKQAWGPLLAAGQITPFLLRAVANLDRDSGLEPVPPVPACRLAELVLSNPASRSATLLKSSLATKEAWRLALESPELEGQRTAVIVLEAVFNHAHARQYWDRLPAEEIKQAHQLLCQHADRLKFAFNGNLSAFKELVLEMSLERVTHRRGPRF